MASVGTLLVSASEYRFDVIGSFAPPQHVLSSQQPVSPTLRAIAPYFSCTASFSCSFMFDTPTCICVCEYQEPTCSVLYLSIRIYVEVRSRRDYTIANPGASEPALQSPFMPSA